MNTRVIKLGKTCFLVSANIYNLFLNSLSLLSISCMFCFIGELKKKQLDNHDDDEGEESGSCSLDVCSPIRNVRMIRASDVMRVIRSVQTHTEEERGWLWQSTQLPRFSHHRWSYHSGNKAPSVLLGGNRCRAFPHHPCKSCHAVLCHTAIIW